MTAAPLGPGSVSLGLAVPGGPATEAVVRLAETAVAAVEAGFDGVTLSEHHGGFPGYLPTPVLVAGLLQERLPCGWAIACPMIIPLRSTALVAEELAWLAAAHPGRVAAGFVPGYQERDFTLVGADYTSRRERYWAQLAELSTLLRGTSGADGNGLAEDPAIAALAATPVPVVGGVAGRSGARRAAAASAGMLLTSLADAGEVAGIVDAYRAAGGSGPRVLIRRVWVGEVRATGAEAKLGRWRAASDGAAWLARPPTAIATGHPDAVVDRLVADARTGGATALNIRIDVDSTDHADVLAQIGELGRSVLPALHGTLAAR